MSDQKLEVCCAICCESFTAYKRKTVVCAACSHVCCTECIKKFLLTLYTQPHCMKCRIAWSSEFIDSCLSYSWRKETWGAHRRQTLLEREKALLPGDMELVPARMELQRIAQELKSCNAQVLRLRLQERKLSLSLYHKRQVLRRNKLQWVKDLPAAQVRVRLKREHCMIRKVQAEIFQVKQLKRNITADHLRLIQRRRELQQQEGKGHVGVQPSERRSFIRACPRSNCRGFLSSAWKCGVCEHFICSQCGAVKGESRDAPHACNDDDVKSMTLIAQETKKCPGCGTNIFRVSGCSQMFCTHCKIAFDWRTNKRITGPLHNPHYFDWLRENKENPVGAMVPQFGEECTHMPIFRDMCQKFKDAKWEDDVPLLLQVYQTVRHIDDLNIRPLQHILANRDLRFRDLRLKFLTHEITEDKWQKLLLALETRGERTQSLLAVLELLRELFIQALRKEEPMEIVTSLQSVPLIFNAMIEKHRSRFRSQGQLPHLLPTCAVEDQGPSSLKRKRRAVTVE